MHPAGTTAILLFTRTPREEAGYKTWRPGLGRKGHAQLARQFVRHVYKTCAYTTLPVFVVDSSMQVGHSFGERFAHALAAVFARGYENVISVGNDTLSLAPADLNAAAAALQQGHAVVGPATDGGAYLIGLTRQQFDAGIFARLRWETHHVCEDLYRLLSQYGANITWLTTRRDIDSPADFADALAVLPGMSRLFRVVQSILASVVHFLRRLDFALHLRCILGGFTLRAPPAIF